MATVVEVEPPGEGDTEQPLAVRLPVTNARGGEFNFSLMPTIDAGWNKGIDFGLTAGQIQTPRVSGSLLGIQLDVFDGTTFSAAAGLRLGGKFAQADLADRIIYVAGVGMIGQEEGEPGATGVLRGSLHRFELAAGLEIQAATNGVGFSGQLLSFQGEKWSASLLNTRFEALRGAHLHIQAMLRVSNTSVRVEEAFGKVALFGPNNSVNILIE